MSSERAIAAYPLTVWTSFASAVINVVLGVLVAWVLVRYEFPLQAAARLARRLCRSRCRRRSPGSSTRASTSKNGWYGRFLVPLGIQGAYSRLGIVLVLVFIGFPFVVRTLQPVLEGLDADVEEAAACLGAEPVPDRSCG